MTKLRKMPFMRDRSWRRVGTISLTACCVLGAIAYASIPDSNGVVHGCYKRNNGTLRVIDDSVSQCDNSETAIQWSQSGPQGSPGPQGPPGLQGSPGPQGPPAPARIITVGTASGTFGLTGTLIRSLQFVKQSDTSNLRITYHDNFYASFTVLNGAPPVYKIDVRIDDAAASPTPIYSLVQDPDQNTTISDINAFGYANGIAAGPHTLTTNFSSDFQPHQCYRGDAYTIEIEEIP